MVRIASPASGPVPPRLPFLGGVVGRWTPWYEQEDGSRLRARLCPDTQTTLEERGDPQQVGHTVWTAPHEDCCPTTHGRRARPVLNTPSGALWWIPPLICRNNPELRDSLFSYISGYYHDAWTYVGVSLEREGKPCDCCGQRRRTAETRWGIESNLAPQYYSRVLESLAISLSP